MWRGTTRCGGGNTRCGGGTVLSRMYVRVHMYILVYSCTCVCCPLSSSYLSAVDRLEILEYVKLILSTIATALRGNPANAKHFQENVSCIFLIPVFNLLIYCMHIYN